MTPLELRRNAAIRLVKEGEIDGVLALSLVVWPPRGSRIADENIPTERPWWPPELKAEIRRRAGEGETMPALAASTGVPFATVKAWLSRADRERDARREAKGKGLGQGFELEEEASVSPGAQSFSLP
jgi:hypothetical protein